MHVCMCVCVYFFQCYTCFTNFPQCHWAEMCCQEKPTISSSSPCLTLTYRLDCLSPVLFFCGSSSGGGNAPWSLTRTTHPTDTIPEHSGDPCCCRSSVNLSCSRSQGPQSIRVGAAQGPRSCPVWCFSSFPPWHAHGWAPRVPLRGLSWTMQPISTAFQSSVPLPTCPLSVTSWNYRFSSWAPSDCVLLLHHSTPILPFPGTPGIFLSPCFLENSPALCVKASTGLEQGEEGGLLPPKWSFLESESGEKSGTVRERDALCRARFCIHWASLQPLYSLQFPLFLSAAPSPSTHALHSASPPSSHSQNPFIWWASPIHSFLSPSFKFFTFILYNLSSLILHWWLA